MPGGCVGSQSLFSFTALDPGYGRSGIRSFTGSSGGVIMLNLFHDFAYSFRLLRKSPAFFLIVVLTIGLGIGVNAAAFNLFNILILRPLPVPQAAEMVRVLRTSQNDSAYHSFSYPNYQDYRERTAEVLDLAAYSQATFTFSRGDVAASNGQLSGPSQEVAGLFASGNYFSILRATMALGQPFSSVQEEKNEVPVAVCSFGFWQSQFGGDPALVGKTIRLNGIIFTVAGVAAKGFSGTEVETPDVWVPIGMQARLTPGSGQISTRGNGWLSVVGRLRENVSMQRAQAAISVTARQLATAYPEVNAKTGVKLGPGVILTPDKQAEFQAIWLLLMAATTLLLVIVCANAASLMITRAVSRAHELALRAALGARRFGLIRLLLTESMSIVTLGGLVGLGLGSWLTSVLMALVRLPSRKAALMLIIGFIFGLVPLAQIRKSAMYGVVQSGSHTLSRAAHGSLVRRVLMV